MRYECQEWGQEYRSAAGERADMGVHLYTEEQIGRVIQRGGAVEVNGRFIDSAKSFANFVQSNT